MRISVHSNNPVFIVLVFGIAIVIIVYSIFFSKKARVLRALKAEGAKRIKDFSDGDTGKIIGKVVFAGETIYGPLSKRPCVYYHVLVEQYRSNGKSSGWHKIIEEERKSDVVIADGTGYALIDAENAMGYLVSDAIYHSGTGDDPTPELKRFLSDHDVDCENFLGFNKNLRYSEGILAKGEKFAVAGEGQWNETKDHTINIPSAKVLVLIPGKKENLVLSDDPEAIIAEELAGSDNVL